MSRTVFEVKIKEPENPSGYPPPFFKKFLGAKSAPRIYTDSEGIEIQEYNGDVLRPILLEILDNLKEIIRSEDESVEGVWTYLDVDPVDYYLYKRKEEWFSSFIFSGCAGMADVSQVVICHWLNVKHRNSPDYYRAIFDKHGFEVLKVETDYEQEIIIPFSGIGYALYGKPEQDMDFNLVAQEDFWECNPFSFDGAIYEEHLEEIEEKILTFLKNTGLNEIPCECKCKLCDPDFTPIQM